MKKITITEGEYDLIRAEIQYLQKENSRLKGYIKGLKEQLRTLDVVGQSEQLKCDQVCDWYRVGHQLNGHQECRTCGRQKTF